MILLQVTMYPESIDTSRLTACLPTEALPDIPEVLDTMDNLESELALAGLAHVVQFNRVYRELTSAVKDGVEDGRTFQQPETVRRTVGIFAQLYFDPLRAYADGEQEKVAAPWKQLIYSPAAESAPGGVQFLLGMNAHINYDLPQALCTSGVNPEYYPDYNIVVGKLINATAHKLSSSYIDAPKIGRKLLIAGTVNRIASWREQAWHAGNDLQEARGDQKTTEKLISKHEKIAERKGKWILPIGTLALNALEIPRRLGLNFGDVPAN